MTQLTDEQVVRQKWPEVMLLDVDDGLLMLWNYRPKVVLTGYDQKKLWHEAAERIRKEQ